MKLTAESTVINDNKLNTNIDNAQTTAETALDKANGSVVTDTLHYLATSQGSGVTTSTAGWTTTVQAMTATNKYLWTYHTYTKANGSTVNTTPVITGTYGEKGDTGAKGDQGNKGDTGVGVSSVQPQYYLSTSASSLSGGSWSTALTYVSGKYIWTRDKVTYSDSTSNYSTAIYNGALTSACANAQSALQIANDTAQYFWFTSSGSDTGAHISEKTQAQFVSNPSGGNLLARSNGIAVRDGLTELATFGTNTRIGLQTSRHIEIEDGGMQVYQDSSTVMAHIGYGLGNAETGTAYAPYFTFGTRVNGSAVGNYSVAEGYLVTASAQMSHAEGRETTASMGFAHAEGYKTTASGSKAHAEGDTTTASDVGAHSEGVSTTASSPSAHAEGTSTTASGWHSHAEGYHTTASGWYSHAGGQYTIAQGLNQMAIGKYNIADTTSLLIIGKGTSDSARSNAFAVSNTGDVYVNGTQVHSSDRRLKEHIAYVGDEAIDFIDSLKPAHYIKDGEHYVGFYAQDVEGADKWDCMVGEMNGYKTLSYMELLAPMVAYIQRLEKRIEELERSK